MKHDINMIVLKKALKVIIDFIPSERERNYATTFNMQIIFKGLQIYN